MLKKTLAMGAISALTFSAAPALQAETIQYRSDLNTLNPGFDSNAAAGVALLTLNNDDVAADGMSGTASLRVQINAAGLPDLTGIDGATHVAHIHGQFAANAGLPPVQQVNGPFFSGEGGNAVDSRTPSLARDDANNNGYLNFFEGLPAYGPVVLNLSDIQVPPAPDGVPPLVQGLNVVQADNGIGILDAFPNNGTTFDLDTTYTFDLSNQDARRQYNNLTPLEQREIVLHGLVVPKEISDALDQIVLDNNLPMGILGVPVGDDLAFRTTGPVAAGKIVRVIDGAVIPTPAAAAAGLSLLGLLGLRRRQA